MLYNHITELIWNTPLLEIPTSLHGFEKVHIYAKLEYYNPFGSVKDRTAWGLIRNNIEDIVKYKKTIIESSSGNTAKALAWFAGVYDTKFKTISNRIKVVEQKETLELLGAQVQQMPWKSECPDPNDPDDPLKVIHREISSNPKSYFYTDQYVNEKNIRIHYETTGKEIWNDLEWKVDYFFAGLGTTWSSRWPATYIREKNPNLQVIWVVSESDDFIPGIRNSQEMWEVWLYEKDFYNSIEITASWESLDAMRDLITKAWVFWGPTTGSTYLWLLQYIKKNYDIIPQWSTCVFIACDRFDPYISYIKQRKPEYFSSVKKDYCVLHISDIDIKKVSYIHPSELYNKLDEKKYLLIDVRSNTSFQNIHIQGSLNIPLEILYNMIDNENLPFCRGYEIILICPYGKETKKAAAFLIKKWYKARILQWGIDDWVELGYEVNYIHFNS